jgi:UDP-4-amino-4,6-dideoxy-N-acetyl-beta-L-altrosamine N-acetyltransferase
MLAGDLSCVLGWRNSPSVRQYMLTQHEIGKQEHQAWFERACADPHRHPLLFEIDGQPSGFVHFVVAPQGGIAVWGFYAAPQAPRGTGRRLGTSALEYGFESLGLHKINGQALALNTPSIRFHQRMSFRQEGVLREQHFDGQKYHDVVCFGLLASEWRLIDHKGEPA